MNGYYTDKFINLILQNKNKLSSKEFIEQKKIEMLFKISGKSVNLEKVRGNKYGICSILATPLILSLRSAN